MASKHNTRAEQTCDAQARKLLVQSRSIVSLMWPMVHTGKALLCNIGCEGVQ
jgi:hypothetical protein